MLPYLYSSSSTHAMQWEQLTWKPPSADQLSPMVVLNDDRVIDPAANLINSLITLQPLTGPCPIITKLDCRRSVQFLAQDEKSSF
jgi:hypothetical protein